jgi:starch-binding outer membrane protein, SusD/RagB family
MDTNKKYSVLLLIVFLLSLTNCSEEILEKPSPPGLETDVTYYQSTDGIKYYLNQVYHSLGEYIMTSHLRSYVSIGSITSDDAWAGGENYGDSPRNHDLNEFRIQSDNREILRYWTHLYQSVRYCNIVIDYASMAIENNPGDEAIINNYKAQAYTIRAYDYFCLVRAFGGVPLVLSSSIEVVPRNTVSEVYNQVLKDLDVAINSGDLIRADEMPAEDKGRLGIGAAKAILAKVHMFMAAVEPNKASDHFSKAYENAREVINSAEFALVKDYSQLWGYNTQFNSESIFEIGFPHPEDNLGTHHWYSTWQRPRYNYKIGTREKNGNDNNTGWGFNTPTQDFVNAFEEGDPRLHWTVWFPGDSTRGLTSDGLLHEICFAHSQSGYYYRKTTSEEFYANMDASVSKKLYRYADLLLLGAEAANEIGQTADALDWLNMVRERARNTVAAPYHENDKIEGIPADVTTNDQAELRNIIRHERRVELGCEGERFFDLIRWHGTHGYDVEEIIKKAGQVVGPDYLVTYEDQEDGILHHYSGQKRSPKEILIELPKHLLLPIPKSEIEATNGILSQNEGY